MNRRQALATFAAMAGLPLLASPLGQALANQSMGNHGKRLILVELAGANDGLNTLVPVTNDLYYKLRPTLALKGVDVLALNDDFALHAALEPLMPLWHRGEMAWIQGLGYPEPNRSHFKSIALWESGRDGGSRQAGKTNTDGWLTHDIEHRLGRDVRDAHGISLAGNMSIFGSRTGRWLALPDTARLLQKRESSHTGNALNPALAGVSERLADLDVTLEQLGARLRSAKPVKRIRGAHGFGHQCEELVRLIRAGVDTPVFRLQLGGFDTHNNQRYQHANRLRALADGLAGLQRELQADGEWQETLIMTYSEFGRRAAENESSGTDHGTAAPHLMLGGRVTGGLHGTSPALDQLIDGDPQFTLDYRAVYQRVLHSWLGIPDNRFSTYQHASLEGLLRA